MRNSFLEAQKKKNIFEMAEIIEDSGVVAKPASVSADTVRLSHEFRKNMLKNLELRLKQIL